MCFLFYGKSRAVALSRVRKLRSAAHAPQPASVYREIFINYFVWGRQD